MATVSGFQHRALAALDEYRTLVLSFERVDYLDAAAFQCIAAIRKEANSRGIAIVCEQVPEGVLGDAATLGMSDVLRNQSPTSEL